MLEYVDDAERVPPAAAAFGVLASVRFGPAPAAADRAIRLVARIPNRPLAPGPAEELWPASGPVHRLALDGLDAAADGRFVFGVVEVDVAPKTSIERPTLDVYLRMLRAVERAGYPHLVRVWNYVPQIHDASSGLERYKQFCKGRSEALDAWLGPDFEDRLPAASAVGCPGDTLAVHLLASRDPGRHVENPRQVSAFRYPTRYGPRSPSFARATVVARGPSAAVLVSGTASIVGHESAYGGDPTLQTDETMRNIEAVLDAADVPGRGGPLGPRLRSMRVYVRVPEHVAQIRAAIRRATTVAVPTAWLQAEICREELLVEIEATAGFGPDAAPKGP
jgi:chorismate lyase/3-hydroxybenzoate synthase